jgi:hypothetical protein
MLPVLDWCLHALNRLSMPLMQQVVTSSVYERKQCMQCALIVYRVCLLNASCIVMPPAAYALPLLFIVLQLAARS